MLFRSNGSPQVQAFSPFAPTAAYSASTVGGSGYFDGSSYLTVPSSYGWDFGTGDFTFSSWLYPTTSDTNQQHTIFRVNGLQMFAYNNSLNFYDGNTYTYGSNIKPFTWNYLEVGRASGILYFFINGTLVGSTADSNAYSGISGGYVGTNGGDGKVIGYLSDCRIIKGTALHTSTYTPPSSPVSVVSGTSILLNYTNAGIPDSAMMNDLETVGNAQVSTTQKKYGTGSLYFDGKIGRAHV